MNMTLVKETNRVRKKDGSLAWLEVDLAEVVVDELLRAGKIIANIRGRKTATLPTSVIEGAVVAAHLSDLGQLSPSSAEKLRSWMIRDKEVHNSPGPDNYCFCLRFVILRVLLSNTSQSCLFPSCHKFHHRFRTPMLWSLLSLRLSWNICFRVIYFIKLHGGFTLKILSTSCTNSLQFPSNCSFLMHNDILLCFLLDNVHYFTSASINTERILYRNGTSFSCCQSLVCR